MMARTRRDFLKAVGAGAGAAVCGAGRLFAEEAKAEALIVNDVHSQLNPTRVARIARLGSLEGVGKIVGDARREGRAVCIAGGRHAMGGQQFATDAVLLDMTGCNRVLQLDAERGTIEVEAGIEWEELVAQMTRLQNGRERQWAIAQKPTGADDISLGGALASNIHGRGLRMKPIIGDVESFALIDAAGEVRRCSRTENVELFRLVIGGYGLFGVVQSVKLRLVPRQKLRRDVAIIGLDEFPGAVEQRRADGYLYGDFQFEIDEASSEFMHRGVFSCYRAVDPATPMAADRRELSKEAWAELLFLAHTKKAEAFQRYTAHYRSTDGQIYWSDTQQLSPYLKGYHGTLDERLKTPARGTEIISELYVPRAELVGFMAEAREDFRRNEVNLIYGTIRLIERDAESFLAWAKQDFACVIFNLHTVHTPERIEHSARTFRRLIEMAARRGGSYYLTYHKFATREQVLACYPQFPEFLRLKKQHDPGGFFASDWHRHYAKMFADA